MSRHNSTTAKTTEAVRLYIANNPDCTVNEIAEALEYTPSWTRSITNMLNKAKKIYVTGKVPKTKIQTWKVGKKV
jgi:DNA-binding IscR family transcriptional regulator